MNCPNCGAVPAGAFCQTCGQRQERHPPTVGHFVADAVEGLTHADSRLWRTLWLLLSRPGFLTLEFFAGRRERYLPPIRLYIVLSLIFFVLLALLPAADVSLNVLDDEEPVNCSQLEYNGPAAERIEPMLRSACQRVVSDDGQAMGAAFQRNVPKAMFVLMPLVAVFMLLFYWRPRRLYAEHLLHLVHNHSAVFGALTLESLLGLALPDSINGWLGLALFIYLVWYCYRGMRFFYGDSRGTTVLKLLGIGFLYATVATILLVFTGVAAALSL